MLKNYLKIAIRNLLKHKAYSFINLAGLAIGIACCVLIMLYVREELSYDRFHENAGRIYRVGNEGQFGSEIWKGGRTSHPLAPALVQEFPEVQRAVRFYRLYKPFVQLGEKKFVEPRFFYADSSVFEVFTFPLVAGDPKTALTRPYSLVLTQEMAKKYFGDADPVGQALSVAKIGDFQITGVLKDIPANSHLAFDFLTAYETLRAQKNPNLDTWDTIVTSTYILLTDGYDPAKLEAKLPALVAKYQNQSHGATQRLFLNPIVDLHLRSEFNSELGERGSIATLSILAVVAAFILLIACINFMNLATARSLQRAREVGVRKVLGATVAQIVLLLSRDFAKLVGLAFVVAAPVAYFAMNRWLQNFAYRAEISLGVFPLAGLMALGLACLTVSWQAIKAALANPVEALRYE